MMLVLELLEDRTLLALLPGVYGPEPPDVTVQLLPDDPRFVDGSLWGLNGVHGINAPAAWDAATGSTGVTVAVVDTGIDYNHPDLYRNVWINQGEIPASIRSSLLDLDADNLITFWDLNDPQNQGPGKIVDANGDSRITGADLLAPTSQGGWANGVSDDGDVYPDDLIGWDFVNNDNNPFDDHGHGTHVSGTIGAVGNDGVGVVGINWKTQLLAVKMLASSGGGTWDWAAQAVIYAADHGALVSNNSWGGDGGSQSLFDAIAYAGQHGQLFVAAAGNNGRDTDAVPFYPASYPHTNIVSVAATDSSGNRASFSNYGVFSVDLGAPGVGILSSLPGNNYAAWNGTSMATPHVAGTAALLRVVNPSWDSQQVKDRLLATTTILPSLLEKTVTGGLLNADAALHGVPTPLPPALQIMDDGDSGFSLTGGGWQYWPAANGPQGHNGDVYYAPHEIGFRTAVWTFPIQPGNYRVSVTWSTHPNRAMNAPYHITNGGRSLLIKRINQEIPPDDFQDNGIWWEDLGTVAVSGSALTVHLTDDADEYVIADAVRVERVAEPEPLPAVRILDDTDPGFMKNGFWTPFVGQGYQNDVTYAAASSGLSVATWTFAATPGQYRISATWTTHANRATDAPYTVYNGAASLGTVAINQEQVPNDRSDGGAWWEDIGTFTVTGNSLVVKLTNVANEYVIADAIRIERIEE